MVLEGLAWSQKKEKKSFPPAFSQDNDTRSSNMEQNMDKLGDKLTLDSVLKYNIVNPM